MFAVYHSPTGLQRIARRVHRATVVLAEGLEKLGVVVLNRHSFDTLTLRTGADTSALHRRAREAGFNLRHIDDGQLGLSLDETVGANDIAAIWRIFGDDGALDMAAIDAAAGDRLPTALVRCGDILEHAVFKAYHSETEMLRYLRSLADKDLALDRSMIPLGSCTMKLNVTTEMLPVTWPEFSAMHPLVPLDQAQGYQQLIEELEAGLCACTGYDAVSLQPNAGSQGEYAGLLAIRASHSQRGDTQRTICLIPSSAHGTN